MDRTQEPEKLKFPLDIQFRIIAEDRQGMHFVIETVLMHEGVSGPLHMEHRSETGKYRSYSVDVRVESLEVMNRIDAALRNIEGVKRVL